MCQILSNLELRGVLYRVKPVGGASERIWMWTVVNVAISYIFRQSECAVRHLWNLGYGKIPKKALKVAEKNNQQGFNREFAPTCRLGP